MSAVAPIATELLRYGKRRRGSILLKKRIFDPRAKKNRSRMEADRWSTAERLHCGSQAGSMEFVARRIFP